MKPGLKTSVHYCKSWTVHLECYELIITDKVLSDEYNTTSSTTVPYFQYFFLFWPCSLKNLNAWPKQQKFKNSEVMIKEF